mgnify:CR=1 FL=1
MDQRAIDVVRTLKQAGYEAYIVGGGVRDSLLGLRPKDFDVATNATPQEISKLFRRSRLIGRRFQIVHVLYGRDVIEVSTFRAYLDSADAVLEAWASLFGERVMGYRAAHHLVDEPAMAVVVQAMVPTDVSGVVFTADPVSGDRNRIVVEAALGQGEVVVGGRVAPDTFVVAKDALTVVDEHLGVQSHKIVAGADGDAVVELSPEEGSARVLEPDRVVQIAQLARSVEEHYGTPQDLEWCLDHDGRLLLVQTRPITTLGSDTRGAQPGQATSGSVLLRGLGATPGVAGGAVRILRTPAEGQALRSGEVLVAPMTDPDWLRRELDEAGDARVGVGFIAFALAERPEALDVALAAGVPAIQLSFGDPRPFAGAIHDAGLVAHLAQLEQPMRDPDAVVEEGFPPLYAAQLEIGFHEHRLDGQAQGRLVGNARGEALLAQRHRARQPAPQVDFPARVGAERIPGAGTGVAPGIGARRARRCAHARPEPAALRGEDGAGLGDAGSGRADVLVALRHELRQPVELGIGERAPPFVGRRQAHRLPRDHRELGRVAEGRRRLDGRRRGRIGHRAAGQCGDHAREGKEQSVHPGLAMTEGPRPAASRGPSSRVRSRSRPRNTTGVL